MIISEAPVYLYSGTAQPSEENAAKAAGHELRSANNYFSVQRDASRNVVMLDQATGKPSSPTPADSLTPEEHSDGFVQTKDHLCLPLQALVDFRGFRLVAMPFLPLQNGR